MHYDDALKLWIAFKAVDVAQVLRDPACRVRPLDQPVPLVLGNSPAADVFGNLVRMNDRDKHVALKRMVNTVLDTLLKDKLEQRAQYWVNKLLEEIKPMQAGSGMATFCYRLPVSVMADLLGIPEEKSAGIAEWVGDFIRCIAPGGTPEQIAVGQEAAAKLRACVQEQYLSAQAATNGSLLQSFKQLENQNEFIQLPQIIANSIGFLTQTYEATAGLIGNTLACLSDYAELQQRITSTPELIPALLEEVLRVHAPIQNTRRFVAEDTVIAGNKISAGSAILVVLAAANLDDSVNPSPEEMDLSRRNPSLFTFGSDSHGCPGKDIAISISAVAVNCLLQQGLNLSKLARPVRFRASLNARVSELAMV